MVGFKPHASTSSLQSRQFFMPSHMNFFGMHLLWSAHKNSLSPQAKSTVSTTSSAFESWQSAMLLPTHPFGTHLPSTLHSNSKVLQAKVVVSSVESGQSGQPSRTLYRGTHRPLPHRNSLDALHRSKGRFSSSPPGTQSALPSTTHSLGMHLPEPGHLNSESSWQKGRLKSSSEVSFTRSCLVFCL